jgi:hypothetical protein
MRFLYRSPVMRYSHDDEERSDARYLREIRLAASFILPCA